MMAVREGKARRRCAVGRGEDDAFGHQPVEVRRPGLRMSPERLDPVVKIIHGDEQHIRFARLSRCPETAAQQLSVSGKKCAQ